MKIDLQTFVLGIWLGINATMAVYATTTTAMIFNAVLCVVWLAALFVLAMARRKFDAPLIKSITIVRK